MRLHAQPHEPRCDVYSLFTPYLTDPRNEAWRDYLFLSGELRAPPRPDGVRVAAAGRTPAIPPERLRVLERLWGRAMPRTSSGAASAMRCWAGRVTTWTSPPTPGRSGSWSCSPRVAGGARSAPSTSTASRSRPSGATTSTRPSPAGHGDLDGRASWRTSAGATSPSTPSPGAGRQRSTTPARGALTGRPDGGHRRPRGSGPARGRRPGRAVRGGRAAAAARCPLRGDARASTSSPRTLAAMRAMVPTRAGCPANASASELRRMLIEAPTVGRPAHPGRHRRAARRAARADRAARRRAGQDPGPRPVRPQHGAPRTPRRASPESVRRLLVAAGLLHDIGKPGDRARTATSSAMPRRAPRWRARRLERLRMSQARGGRGRPLLIHEHMFQFRPAWTDAAVRRFLRRVGLDRVDDVLRLREADDIGSGAGRMPAGCRSSAARVEAQRLVGCPARPRGPGRGWRRPAGARRAAARARGSARCSSGCWNRWSTTPPQPARRAARATCALAGRADDSEHRRGDDPACPEPRFL